MPWRRRASDANILLNIDCDQADFMPSASISARMARAATIPCSKPASSLVLARRLHLLGAYSDRAQQRLFGVEHRCGRNRLHEGHCRGAIDMSAGQHGNGRPLAFGDQLGLDSGAFPSELLRQLAVDGRDDVGGRIQHPQAILRIRLWQGYRAVDNVEHKLADGDCCLGWLRRIRLSVTSSRSSFGTALDCDAAATGRACDAREQSRMNNNFKSNNPGPILRTWIHDREIAELAV